MKITLMWFLRLDKDEHTQYSITTVILIDLKMELCFLDVICWRLIVKM